MRPLLIWLLLTGTADAACVTLNQSSWTQDEKNGTVAVAYELAFASGHDEVPTVTGGQVCAATFNPTGIITQAAMETQWASDESARQAATTALLAKQQAFASEITANDLCTAELTDLDTRIDNGVNGITDLASAKTFLRVALKKIARCLRSRTAVQR